MRIYFGSTYSDLKAHRDAAISALQDFAQRNAKDYVNYDVFDPDTFSAQGVSHLDACLREVKESSYFVLILGWRYGYIPEGSEKSIVELEYEAAIEARNPLFCFFIDDSYPISPKYIETGEGAGMTCSVFSDHG